MEETSKKLSADLATELRAWLETAEVKTVIDETEKAAAKDTGSFEIVITTENVDRYQEIIKLDAWELDHYMKNPVVLWGHDHRTLPVGVTASLTVKDGKLVAAGKFAPHEHGQTVRKLYDMGVLRAASVGFIEKEREGNLITKAELIEWSIVSVPANPYCLSTIKKSGASIDELVTKGFVFIEKEAEEEKPEEEAVVTEETPEEVPAEKKLDKKSISIVVTKLKEAIEALEDLPDEEQEPEGDEAPTDDETEEQKQFREFSEKRKLLQDASTMLAEVLAEARQAIEARK